MHLAANLRNLTGQMPKCVGHYVRMPMLNYLQSGQTYRWVGSCPFCLKAARELILNQNTDDLQTAGLHPAESIPNISNQAVGLVEAPHPESALEQAVLETSENTPPKDKIDMVEMAVAFVSPALFGKLGILFFGSNYSAHPGKGYGIGLSLSILFTLVMLGRFVWRYRHYSED